MKDKWYSQGLRFQCQGSGKCCSSRGQYGYVYLTGDDRERMARQLNLDLESFTKKYCKKQGRNTYFLKSGKSPDCVFLNKKKCSIYEARPIQCKTWPFWPESMDAKVWSQEVESFCPGVGKGRLYSQIEIESIIEEQISSELQTD